MDTIILTTAIQNLVPNKPFVVRYTKGGAVESDLDTLSFEDTSVVVPTNDDIIEEYNRLKTIEDNKTPTDTAKDKLKDLGFSDEEIEVII